MPTAQAERHRIDVLIVTAVPDEYAAVLAVDTGAADGSAWEARTASTGLELRVRPFVAAGGGLLWVGVTQGLGMGGVEAVSAAAQLVPELHVRCLAMCGVCAGRRGDVALGDVIIADRLWPHGTGKVKVGKTKGGRRVTEEREDIEMYRIAPPAWKQDAERFEVDPKAAWMKARPRSYEMQGDWVLERVLEGARSVEDLKNKTMCTDLPKVLARLWDMNLLRKGKLTLTAAGRKHIDEVRMANGGKLPKPPRFRTRVGPIASVSKVVEDPAIFDKLSTPVRKVLGLEMEAAAIGSLAHARGIKYAVVMKGVMDHADSDKSDNFKKFAARASAECLIAFVRAHLPVEGDGDDEILVPGTSPVPEKAGPAALLNARHEVVGFVGREALLAELRGWCMGVGRVRASLIHAPGGMGKTRLAIELCKQMRAVGWRAGFVPKALGVDRFATLVESEQPVLAVIDYAESRERLRDLMELAAAQRGKRNEKRLRLILLARNADDWLTDLLRSDGPVKDLLSEKPTALQTLASAGEDRAVVFQEAVRAFAKAEYKKALEGEAPNLKDRRYERALYVHMAALAAVEGWEATADTLLEEALDHEERFWREQLRERGRTGERVALDKMRRAVAALTLVGGASSAVEAGHIIGDEGLALLLRDLYPGAAAQYIAGLEPDLLGEAMVWRVLSKEGTGAGPYLDRVFERADQRAIRTGFEVLGRLSEDHKEAEGWIACVLGHDMGGRAMEAFAAARSVGERTAHARLGSVLANALVKEGTVEIAEQLEPALPHPEQTVSLREVGRWVLEKQLKHMPEGTEETRARRLNDLSIWQSALGNREAALALIQEAVALCRRLVDARPDVFLPDLARGLTNLGLRQRELGAREAALASAQEAVALYRHLAEALPDAFRAHLAASLNNLGLVQRAVGNRQAALASTQEAVALRRHLAEARPDAFLPDLARSLTNLGGMQIELDDREGAFASVQEAVALRRRLVEARPDAFLPDLAGSLSNLGAVQSALGDQEAALVSTQEAVAIQRRLAEVRRDAFMPRLAVCLHNLSENQRALDQLEPALASGQEALDAYWPFFLAHPAAFARDTANVLANLLQILEALSRPASSELLERRAAVAAHLGG